MWVAILASPRLGGHIDGRISADEHAKQHDDGEDLHRLAAHNSQAQQRQECGQGRDDGARQCLIGGQINDVTKAFLFVLAHIFTHAVKHHDSVVHRIANDGEQGSNRCE